MGTNFGKGQEMEDYLTKCPRCGRKELPEELQDGICRVCREEATR